MPPPNFHRHRYQAKEVRLQKAFMSAVEEAAINDNIIYISPDTLRDMIVDGYTPEEALRVHLDTQVEGAAEALRLSASDNLGRNVGLDFLSKEFSEKLPAAMPNISIDGQEYGAVILPSKAFDTKEEIVRTFIDKLNLDEGTVNKIVSNIPGTDEDWIRIAGIHEGEHLNMSSEQFETRRHHLSKGDITNAIQEEVRADKSAIGVFEAEGKHDVVRAYKDLRHLLANADSLHATGTVLNSGDAVNGKHVESLGSYRQNMGKFVEQNFDFDSFFVSSSTPNDLMYDDPDAYFESVNLGLDKKTVKIMNEYRVNPLSYDGIDNVVSLQIETEYIKNYEGAWRRLVEEEKDFPEHEQTQLVSQEIESAHIAEYNLRLEIDEMATLHGEEEVMKYYAYDIEKAFPEGSDIFALQEADGKQYYNTILSSLEDQKNQAFDDYKKNPSYENAEELLKVEHITKDIYREINHYLFNNFEKVVEFEPFVPEDIRHDYYEEYIDKYEEGLSSEVSPFQEIVQKVESEIISEDKVKPATLEM